MKTLRIEDMEQVEAGCGEVVSGSAAAGAVAFGAVAAAKKGATLGSIFGPKGALLGAVIGGGVASICYLL